MDKFMKTLVDGLKDLILVMITTFIFSLITMFTENAPATFILAKEHFDVIVFSVTFISIIVYLLWFKIFSNVVSIIAPIFISYVIETIFLNIAIIYYGIFIWRLFLK